MCMRDFTLHKWRSLLCALRRAGYVFLSFEDYLTAEQLPEKFVILRHDIDRITAEALRIARLERSLNVRATYYFRTNDKQNMPAIMQAISGLGFEVGYHYEDMTASNGDIRKAYRRFVDNVTYCRQYAPIRTVCMHGNPWSRYDEKTLWQHYDFRESGIIGEPYLNTDFTDVFYLTDTGRRWDGYNVSVRDKIPVQQQIWLSRGWHYHSTEDILSALSSATFPHHVMLTAHPQRWHDRWLPWLYEWGRQHMVNIVKRILVWLRK